jgi:hypothetical protein
MILTKDNIKEWKSVLDKEMFKQTKFPNYSQTLSDEDWIDINEGESVQEVIDNEMSYWTE